MINKKSDGPINLTNHWRKGVWISLHVDLKRFNTIICQPEDEKSNFNRGNTIYARQNVIDQKKKEFSKIGQTPSMIGICSYCVLDKPVFERYQTLLHPELTPWWSFLLADGAHHKKPHSPTHPLTLAEKRLFNLHNDRISSTDK